MGEKACDICVFYKPPTEGLSCGVCGYPVPEWLRLGAVSPYISMPDFTGKSCATFKSKVDLVNETIKEVSCE